MVRDLRIRRLASRRLAVLTCGHSDPWRRSTEPPSEKMVTAGREAAEHLAACGLTPILGVSTLRGLWLRGGRDRQLAELLHRLCE
ncbi:hypothetical protein B1T48_13995 [Mycobacterium persicum]|nr:hypothetical protein B1T48_13995 [Mycobacterium persicum]